RSRGRHRHIPKGIAGDREVFALKEQADEPLEVAALLLLALDGLEERLEVADAESAGPVALDDLEEEGGPILHWLGEDLEQVALLVAIGLDAKLLERIHRYADVAYPLGQRHVVLVRQPQELDPALSQGMHRADDVRCAQGDVL